MPWKSDAQRRWGHSEAGKKALGGAAAVHEWDEATKGKHLPEKVKKSELEKTASPMHAGTHATSVKIPKQKKMPGPDAKPSVFFKSEELPCKHPSVCKLRDFLMNVRSKR